MLSCVLRPWVDCVFGGGPEDLEEARSGDAIGLQRSRSDTRLWADVLLDRQAVEAQKQALGAEHPETLASQADLAAALVKMGRPSVAEALYRQVVEGRERALGARHPDTLTTKGKLAGLLWDMGRRSEALPLYRQLVEARGR